MVYTGSPYKNGTVAELVDLMNPDSKCLYSVKLPYNVSSAFGGKIDNKSIFCGGAFVGYDFDHRFHVYKDCYVVGENIPFVQLTNPRYGGASVMLPNGTLFITGRIE